MKFYYIANARIPTEKAHGIQIANMCQAFVTQGVDLELLVPKRKNFIKDNIFEYYGIEKKFDVKYFKIVNLVNKIPYLGFLLQSFIFAFKIKKYLDKNYKKGDIIYSRDIFSLWFLRNTKYKLFYEIHNWPNNLTFLHRILFFKIKFIAISQGLINELLIIGIKKENIFLAPDGVSLKKFDKITDDKKVLRNILGLPEKEKIVLYTGHLYKWKGAQTLLDAAAYINAKVYFLGGTKEDINIFKDKVKIKNLNNVYLLGHKPHDEMPKYMKSADILVLPNSKDSKISKYYTSPMKLFEYLASGVPIVASDLPSIREILLEEEAIWVDADNYKSLAKSINVLLEDDELNKKISKNYKKKILGYSWENRAKNIINFINFD